MEANKIIITGGATRMGAAIARKLSGPNKEILIIIINQNQKQKA
jgi:short-subunit dehydrogenase involved in D-alanine esterification of teichoic acids